MTRQDILALAGRVEAGEDSPALLISLLDIDPFTDRALTSLDATEALRLRLLPGSSISVSLDFTAGVKVWDVSIWLNDDNDSGASAPTEARARLAAILRAYAETMK